jgi:hypothetical protein
MLLLFALLTLAHARYPCFYPNGVAIFFNSPGRSTFCPAGLNTTTCQYCYDTPPPPDQQVILAWEIFGWVLLAIPASLFVCFGITKMILKCAGEPCCPCVRELNFPKEQFGTRPTEDV